MIDIFEEFFRGPGGIRVELNWEAIRRDCVVVPRVVVSWAEVGDWYFPWYVNDAGEETSYDSEDANPIGVGSLSRESVHLGASRVERIEELRDSFANVGERVQLIAPAYFLNDDQGLFLDGCHRLAALLPLDLSVRILILALKGPINPGILPDLRFWAAERRGN